MTKGPIFKYKVGYCWDTQHEAGDAEMTVEALDIIQAATIAKTKLKNNWRADSWIVSIVQQD